LGIAAPIQFFLCRRGTPIPSAALETCQKEFAKDSRTINGLKRRDSKISRRSLAFRRSIASRASLVLAPTVLDADETEGTPLKVIRLFVGVVASALILTIPTQDLFANTVNWANWTSQAGIDPGCQKPATVNGSAGIVDIKYSGDTCGIIINYPSWTPASTYADGTIVANAPLSGQNIIKLYGGTPDVNTIMFSTPVVNPVMAIWSLGAPGSNAEFIFNQTPSFVTGGPNAEYGGTAITVTGNTVSGAEGNGTIQFKGTFSSLSWTNPFAENWYGFTVGYAGVAAAAVPEPSSFLLLGTALLGLWLVCRSRQPERVAKFRATPFRV
jgi:hypothetical protein